MDKIIKNYRSIPFCELRWCMKEDIMYQADMSHTVEYGEDYFKKYMNYESTEIAIKLNNFRTNITEKYCSTLLDIGIGSGEFIKSSKIKTFGFDINPLAERWLKDNNLFKNPYIEMPSVDGLTFWDSLEHIPEPCDILSLTKSKQYVFVSMPIFSDLLSLKNSKHYRPNEHYYYFTSKGMIQYMQDLNYSIVEIQDGETQAGREDILTFVFQKN
jgi:hypothetical protein